LEDYPLQSVFFFLDSAFENVFPLRGPDHFSQGVARWVGLKLNQGVLESIKGNELLLEQEFNQRPTLPNASGGGQKPFSSLGVSRSLASSKHFEVKSSPGKYFKKNSPH